VDRLEPSADTATLTGEERAGGMGTELRKQLEARGAVTTIMIHERMGRRVNVHMVER
jgi:hypothetical protein